ncbi:YciI family protein [Methylopila turkensis]|uniref:YciI family protein n=1 Tax=Methylopila turkensis TaxID=1437816 RepID=UPI0028527DEE|nr:YciI family protein [Methylopila turkensis]
MREPPPGPSWVAGRSIDEQDAATLGAHLAALGDLFESGRLLFAGPFTAEDGGVLLLAARDCDDARATLDRDPAVAAGLLTYLIKPVETVFDAAKGVAWSAA